jgi:hypothetical protein
MKRWTPEHIRLGLACNRVSRRLLDLANCRMVLHAHPALQGVLINLAGELRRGFRPHREIPSRDAEMGATPSRDWGYRTGPGANDGDGPPISAATEERARVDL